MTIEERKIEAVPQAPESNSWTDHHAQELPDAAGTDTSRSFVRRHAWWLAIVVLIAAGITWRALGPDGSTASYQQRVATPVRAAAVLRGDLNLLSTYPGEIVGEVADIAPEVAGILRDMPVRIGDRVRKGQVLAVINDVNLRNQSQEARGQVGVAEANERRSEAELATATAEHRRATELMEQSLLSEQEFDRVTAALATSSANVAAAGAQTQQARARLRLLEQQLADSRVQAPFDGTVADRYVDRGTLVQPGTPLLRLVQDAVLRVQFRVPERDLGAVRVGVPFAATTVATGSTGFSGTVERVAGEVSRADRTAIVEGALTDRDEVLKPGMYAEVRVQLREVRDSLLVPATAVVDRISADGSQSLGVFVALEAEAPAATGEAKPEEGVSSAAWADIEVLGSSEGKTAIRGAIDEGALVLTMGHGDLRDGATIRVVQIDREAGARSPGKPELQGAESPKAEVLGAATGASR